MYIIGNFDEEHKFHAVEYHKKIKILLCKEIRLTI